MTSRLLLFVFIVLSWGSSTALAQVSGGVSGDVTIHDPNTPSQKAAVNGSGQLSMTCANCSGSGASAVDAAVFTQGTDSIAPAGMLYKTNYTALTTGHIGVLRGFSDGSLFSMGNVASGVTDTGNPLKIGGIFNTTQPTVTTGQRVDFQATARGALIAATGADVFNVTVNAALPAGTNVIGHVIADSGSTTAVTQATAANLNATIVGSKTNNNAAPSSTNVGVLGALANAAAPAWTEGNLTAASVDLHGSQRTLVMKSDGTTATLATDATSAATSSTTGPQIMGNGSAATPSAVSDGQAVAIWTDVNGRLHTTLEHAQGSTTSGQLGDLVLGAVTTSAPTYTTGQSSPLSLDTSGSVRVAVVSGSTGNAAAGNTGSAVPTQADYGGVNIGGTLRGRTGVNPSGSVYAAQTDLTSIAGTTTSVNNGAVDAGTLRVTLANNSTGTVALAAGSAQIGHLEANQSANIAQINGVTPLMGNGATGTGAIRVSLANDSTGVVQPGNTANTTPWLVQAVPGTTNGTTNYSTGWSSAAVFTAEVKASAGTVYSFDCFNNSTAKRYVRLYNQTGAPASTDTANIVWRGIIPSDSTNSNGGFVKEIAVGKAFGTGIGIRITAAVADNDTTALAANDVVCNLGYK